MTPWHNSDGSRRRGTVPPTRLRYAHDGHGHAMPASGVDRTGAPWAGTSRIIDRAGRRKANRASWRKAITQSARIARASRAARAAKATEVTA